MKTNFYLTVISVLLLVCACVQGKNVSSHMWSDNEAAAGFIADNTIAKDSVFCEMPEEMVAVDEYNETGIDVVPL